MNRLKKICIGTAATVVLWFSLDSIVADMALRYQLAAKRHYAYAADYLSVAKSQLRTEQDLSNHLVMISYQENESPQDNYTRAVDQRQNAEVCAAKAEKCMEFLEKYSLSSTMSRLIKKVF